MLRSNRTLPYIELIPFMVLIIFLRPLLDLQGKFEGDGINAGGIAGLILALSSLCLFLSWTIKHQVKKWNMYIFLAMISLSTVYLVHFFSVPNNAIVISGLRYLFGFSAIIFILGDFPNAVKRYVKKYFSLMIFMALIPIVIAVLQIFGKIPYSYFDYSEAGIMYGRPTGGYYQPNSFARIMIFIFIIACIMRSSGQISKKSSNLIILTTLFSVIISTHRTSMIVILLCLIVYCIAFKIRLRTEVKFAMLWIAVAASPLIAKIFEPVYVESSFRESVSSGRGRYDIWATSIEYFNSLSIYDKLFGIGYSKFEPHNDFANIILQSGCLGLFVIIGVLSYAVYMIYKSVSRVGQVYLCMLIIFYIAYAINLQPSEYPYFMEMYFLTLALILGVYRENGSQ